jgi:hypothetical protein
MAAAQPELVPVNLTGPAEDRSDELTLKLDGVFDGASAWELRHRLEAVRSAHRVVLDFSRVREFYDFGVAVLAHGLAQRSPTPPVHFKGLRTHQLRLFKYFGVDADR